MNDSIQPPNYTLLYARSEDSPEREVGFKATLPAFAWEIVYQLAVIFVLLVFFSFSLDETEQLSISTVFTPYKLAFFGNYLMAALIIGYIFLPLLYYKKRILLFVIATIVLIISVVLIDEFVLEQIFFPDTRGMYFPGLIFTVVETLPIIIIMVAFKIGWDINRKQREVEKLKNLVKESEMQFLKSQINPHFLFNNLNNLYAYALDSSPKTPTIILELSSVLRYMLYDCKTDSVELSKEINHLEHYISLYKLQLDGRGEVRFKKDIPTGTFIISPLILSVFIENAFKHSSESQTENIQIDIDVKVSTEGSFTFLCSNTYQPHANKNKSAHGIGLRNVKKRLELLYPNQYQCEIKNDGNLFIVTLNMQLKKKSYA